jgi:hypothetical protein
MGKPAKFVINYAPQVRKGPISSPSISIALTLWQNYKPAVRSVANTSNRINFVSEQSYPRGTSNGDTQTGNVVPGSTFYLVLKVLRNLKVGYKSSIPSTGWRELTGRALDKKKVKRQFVPKTKARIMRRETTVPKVPEDPEEEKKLKQGKAGEKVVKVEEEEKSKDEDEDMSDEDEDEDDSEEQSAPKTNGKNLEHARTVTARTSNRSGDDAKGRYQKVLETRMAEIQYVFAKGAARI